jgi:hypothetical protein
MPAQLMELMRHKSIDTTLSYYVGRNAERTAAMLWEQDRKTAVDLVDNSGEVSKLQPDNAEPPQGSCQP